MNDTLRPRAFNPLSLGQIVPRGWLRDQLELQAEGITGHLDEFWPSVRDSRWIGGEGDGWERGPYWLDGLIPLAFLLDGVRLKVKAQYWVDSILEHQDADGWLGPKHNAHQDMGEENLDPWPLFVIFKAFLQWREATADERIVPALLRCARRIAQVLAVQPLRSWAWVRWADFVLSLHTLYELTGETWLLDVAQTARAQGYDWVDHFAHFRYPEKTRPEQLSQGSPDALLMHVVNNAMGLKSGPVWWRQSGEADDQVGMRVGLTTLDRYHGTATGMFNGDEHLAGLNPSQGHELCAIVEEMFSLEQAIAITGDAALCERLERIAYNALPGHMTPDMWAHQYHGGSNQVLCSHVARPWTDANERANLYGQDVHFGCCQANFHQGWPKLASHLWMSTGDGLVATCYAPCEVTHEVQGVRVTVEETTSYPFTGEVRFGLRTEQPIHFALSGYVPSWAEGATLEIAGETQAAAPDTFWRVEREWADGDVLILRLPLELRGERRFNHALTVMRGPLVLALRVGEEFRLTNFGYEQAEPRAHEWEVFPVTAWNYALDVNEEGLRALMVQENPIPALPFAENLPPLIVEVPACRVEVWQLENNVAAPPPASPVACESEPETVQLVPFGCTRLRVAELPTCR